MIPCQLFSATYFQTTSSRLPKLTRYAKNQSSVFFIYRCAGDTCEAGEKPLLNGFNRIGCGFRYNPAVARSDVQAKKSLTVARSGASTPS